MINITEKAAKQMLKSLKKRGSGLGVRLGVRTSGCSGMAYNMEFVDEADEMDEIYEMGELKVFVSKKDLVYLDGTSVDYAREGLQEGFKFENPNAKATCGCGESFSI